MRYKFHLRDSATGFSRIYENDYDYSEVRGMFYQWLSGNFSCDCNRSRFLYPESDIQLDCSELRENRIVLDKIVDELGNIVFEESGQTVEEINRIWMR